MHDQTNIKLIIERLRKERRISEKQYYDKGVTDGLNWAKLASYNDLQFALFYRPFKANNYEPSYLDLFDEIVDSLLLEYLQDVILFDDLMGYMPDSDGEQDFRNPNCIFKNWEIGWHSGVISFWDNIKDQI